MQFSKNKSSGFTLVELMIVVAIIGILSTIAIPDFMKFTAKAKQAEAKANLGAIYVSQMAYFGATGEFAGKSSGGQDAFELIGWSIESVTAARYTYILDEAIIEGANVPASLPQPISSSSTGFTAIAAGNIDNDLFVDVWAINDIKELRNQVPNDSNWGADGSDILN